MTPRWKWIAIGVGAVVGVSLWLLVGPEFGIIAGVSSAVGWALGRGVKDTPLPDNARDNIADLVDDGLSAHEKQVAAERAARERAARDAIAAADAKLEEDVNAPVDDPLAWTRPDTDD